MNNPSSHNKLQKSVRQTRHHQVQNHFCHQCVLLGDQEQCSACHGGRQLTQHSGNGGRVSCFYGEERHGKWSGTSSRPNSTVRKANGLSLLMSFGSLPGTRHPTGKARRWMVWWAVGRGRHYFRGKSPATACPRGHTSCPAGTNKAMAYWIS